MWGVGTLMLVSSLGSMARNLSMNQAQHQAVDTHHLPVQLTYNAMHARHLLSCLSIVGGELQRMHPWHEPPGGALCTPHAAGAVRTARLQPTWPNTWPNKKHDCKHARTLGQLRNPQGMAIRSRPRVKEADV